MLYDIRLVIAASYDQKVPFARHVLRLSPRDRPGQRVVSTSLTIDPPPMERRDSLDFFGNQTSFISIAEPHTALVVRAGARVEVTAPARLEAARAPAWEAAAAAAAGVADLSRASPAHFLFPSRIVGPDAAIAAYAGESFPPGASVLAGAIDLMGRIHADFTYDTEATDVATPPAVAFALKRGVCQDYAHVMLTGLRALGLAGGYVSGFLRTTPPPGRPRLEGVDATHAWVTLWCGPDLGWVGLDPTNAVLAGEDHVVIGVGRDYADVAPLDGVIVTNGAQALDVAVDVAPVGEAAAAR